MTIEQLSKYFYIKIEVEQLEERLNNFKMENTVYTQLEKEITYSSKKSDPTESIFINKLKLENKLRKKQNELLAEELKIESFIATVDDPEIRIIIRSRFIECKSWEIIGKKLHYDRTTPYNHLKNYLEGKTYDEKQS